MVASGPQGEPSPDYQPSKEDRAESTSDSPLELTLAQQLLMKQYEEQIERMSTEECQKLAAEVVRQMMVKDNILSGMLKDEKAMEFIQSLQPPDPYDSEFTDDEEEEGGGKETV